jgi:hypothetical protein
VALTGASDEKVTVKEGGIQIGTASRTLNFVIDSDFDIVEDETNNEIEIKIAANAIGDSHIATHTSTKITLGSVAQIPDHAAEHKSGGGDAIKLDELAAPTDVTTLNSSASAHGLLPKLNDNGSYFLNGVGQWALPPGAQGGEANTATNAGTGGIGITLAKSGIDLPFKSIAAASSKVSITDDPTNKNVDIDVVDASETQKGVVELATSAETTAGLAVQASDTRLSNPRAPTAHATSHQAAGGDSIRLDDLAATEDNTDLNASTLKHGLLPKLPGNTTTFLRGDGTFAAPSLASGVAVLDKEMSEILVQSTVNETTIFTYNIAGGTLGSTGKLRLEIAGNYYNNTGYVAYLTIRIKLDSTVIYNEITGDLPDSTIYRAIDFRIYLTANNSTTSQKLGGHLSIGYPGTVTAGVGDLSSDEGVIHSPIRGTSSLDMSSSRTLSVTVQHDYSSVNQRFYRDSATLELL